MPIAFVAVFMFVFTVVIFQHVFGGRTRRFPSPGRRCTAPGCGEKNPAHAKFCAGCGMALNNRLVP